MKSNYKTLVDYIQEVKVRNSDLAAKDLLGISIDKFFMPSVANVVGTDLSVYRVVKKNQFACNRMHVGRDYRIPISLSRRDEPFMVSPAYDVFEIKDTEVLDPEFLMMWFSRAEYDRNAWFYTDADVRGGLPWKVFADMKFPLLSLSEQKVLVAEYKIIQDRINLNQQLIQKLEGTAEAIYKDWFLDFEFPNENTKPYLSSGGAMEFDDELRMDIPKGWSFGRLGDLIEVVNGYAFKSNEFKPDGMYPIIKISNIQPPEVELDSGQYFSGELNKSIERCILEYGDILISMTGSHINQIESAAGKVGRYIHDIPALINQRIGKIKTKKDCQGFVFLTLRKIEIQKEILMSATGSANQANISPDTIKNVKVLLPSNSLLNSFETLYLKLQKQRDLRAIEIRKLENFKSLLLSKMATTGV